MNDGSVNNMTRLVQPLLFADMTFEGMGPTDIDGFMESNGRDFLFTEVKHINAALNKNSGQIRALVALCDAVNAGGAKAALVFAQHNIEVPTAIEGKNCMCMCMYTKDGWRDLPEGITLDKLHRKFLQNAGRLI